MKLRLGLAFLLSLTALLLTACAARYPLGMAEEEWQQLTPRQQLDARQKQAELDEAARARRAEEARLAAEQERLAQERYRERLRNAGPGEVVQCVLQDAEGYYAGKWRPAEPAGFTVLTGYSVTVDLAEQNRHTRSTQVEAKFDGANVQLCRPHRNECTTLAATTNQLQQGVQRRVRLDHILRGTLYCDTPTTHRVPRKPVRRFH